MATQHVLVLYMIPNRESDPIKGACFTLHQCLCFQIYIFHRIYIFHGLDGFSSVIFCTIISCTASSALPAPSSHNQAFFFFIFNTRCVASASRQGRADPAANKGGPHARGVALLWQHQVRHLRDRGVPAVRPGLRLGAVVSVPQPTKVLVGATQPHSTHQVSKGAPPDGC